VCACVCVCVCVCVLGMVNVKINMVYGDHDEVLDSNAIRAEEGHVCVLGMVNVKTNMIVMRCWIVMILERKKVQI